MGTAVFSRSSHFFSRSQGVTGGFQRGFAALHGTLTEKCYALGMGLIFGWAAEQTDSPAPGVVLHILNNGLVLARALAERGMG